jgi:hypothetical protein
MGWVNAVPGLHESLRYGETDVLLRVMYNRPTSALPLASPYRWADFELYKATQPFPER